MTGSHSERVEDPEWLATDGGTAGCPASGHCASKEEDRTGETCANLLLQCVLPILG